MGIIQNMRANAAALAASLIDKFDRFVGWSRETVKNFIQRARSAGAAINLQERAASAASAINDAARNTAARLQAVISTPVFAVLAAANVIYVTVATFFRNVVRVFIMIVTWPIFWLAILALVLVVFVSEMLERIRARRAATMPEAPAVNIDAPEASADAI